MTDGTWFRDVDMIDSLHAVVVGDSGLIWRTTDCGLTWTSHGSGTQRNLLAVTMVNTASWWAVGDSGTILHTPDAGTTVVIQASPTTVKLNGVSLFDTNSGVAVGNYGTILTTTNGGSTWRLIVGGPASWDLLDVQWVNSNVWIASGAESPCVISFNGGQSWQTGSFGEGVTRLARTGEATVMGTVPTSGVLRSDDFASSWMLLPFPSDIRGYWYGQDVSYTDVLHGVAGVSGVSGSSPYVHGFVLRTSDGGSTWTVLDMNSYLPSRISFGTARHGIAVGDFGVFVSSRAWLWYPFILVTSSAGDPVAVDGDLQTGVPTTTMLYQNYPNPFNPSTTIRYGLPSSSYVTLAIFNTLGQQIATLVEGEVEAGYHEVLFDASRLSSGVYLSRSTAGSYVETRKLVFVR